MPPPTDNIIDFDEFLSWKEEVGAAVVKVCGSKIVHKLTCSTPEYLEDAEDVITGLADTKDLVRGLLDALRSKRVRIYHATRLRDEDRDSLLEYGLRPLSLVARRASIVHFAQHHSRWAEIEMRLDECIEKIGLKQAAGHRENGCVYGCFSKTALLASCDHYLQYGSEAEQHVAHCLCADSEMQNLMQEHRRPYLVSFTKSFDEVIHATNPFGWERGYMPAGLGRFVRAWAYSLTHQSFDTRRQKDDFAARFDGGIAPECIEGVELIR